MPSCFVWADEHSDYIRDMHATAVFTHFLIHGTLRSSHAYTCHIYKHFPHAQAVTCHLDTLRSMDGHRWAVYFYIFRLWVGADHLKSSMEVLQLEIPFDGFPIPICTVRYFNTIP